MLGLLSAFYKDFSLRLFRLKSTAVLFNSQDLQLLGYFLIPIVRFRALEVHSWTKNIPATIIQPAARRFCSESVRLSQIYIISWFLALEMFWPVPLSVRFTWYFSGTANIARAFRRLRHIPKRRWLGYDLDRHLQHWTNSSSANPRTVDRSPTLGRVCTPNNWPERKQKWLDLAQGQRNFHKSSWLQCSLGQVAALINHTLNLFVIKSGEKRLLIDISTTPTERVSCHHSRGYSVFFCYSRCSDKKYCRRKQKVSLFTLWRVIQSRNKK